MRPLLYVHTLHALAFLLPLAPLATEHQLLQLPTKYHVVSQMIVCFVVQMKWILYTKS
jgi:hypothetical protein